MKRNIHCLAAATSLLFFSASLLYGADLLTEGGRAFDRGDYREAIRLLEAARSQSSDCRISFYLGLSHYRLQQLDEAIIDLAGATKCAPRSTEFRSALAEAYAQKRDDNRALAELEAILELDPGNVAALRAAAALYLRHDMSEKALAALEKLATFDKNNAAVEADLAAAYAANNRLDEAGKTFDRALSLDPRNVSALVGIGNVYFKTGHYQESVRVLTRAIALNPHAYQPLVLRARCYARLNRNQDAITDLQKSIKLAGHKAEIEYYLAQTYRATGREDEAQKSLALFRQWRNESDRSAEAQRDAARMMREAQQLVRGGDVSGAVKVLERALDASPGNAPVLFRLAGVYFTNHQDQKALASIHEAITVAPAQWDYHYLQGLIEEGVGEFDRAHDSLEIAVRLNPAVAEAHNQLGGLAMRRRDFVAAQREFQEAVRLAPQEALYRSNLETAQQNLTVQR